MTVKCCGRPEIVESLFLPEFYGINVLYMPVKLAGDDRIALPSGLEFLSEIVAVCLRRDSAYHKYVYVSYECSFVRKGVSQKRPGWHADGFMTEDINFIWYSTCPTVFNSTEFNVKLDHKVSMEQFEAQVNEDLNYRLPCNALIRLDQTVVHRADPAEKDEVRTFFKLSISTEKYNLKGNAHNPEFDYLWTMHDRSIVRNHPTLKEVDSVKAGIL